MLLNGWVVVGIGKTSYLGLVLLPPEASDFRYSGLLSSGSNHFACIHRLLLIHLR